MQSPGTAVSQRKHKVNFVCSLLYIKATFMKKPANARVIIYVVYWPYLHVSVAFSDHPQGAEY